MGGGGGGGNFFPHGVGDFTRTLYQVGKKNTVTSPINLYWRSLTANGGCWYNIYPYRGNSVVRQTESLFINNALNLLSLNIPQRLRHLAKYQSVTFKKKPAGVRIARSVKQWDGPHCNASFGLWPEMLEFPSK